MDKIFSKHIPILYIFLSVLLLLFVVYKAEYFHQGTKVNYYKIYYIIATISLFFSIINFFLEKELKMTFNIDEVLDMECVDDIIEIVEEKTKLGD